MKSFLLGSLGAFLVLAAGFGGAAWQAAQVVRPIVIPPVGVAVSMMHDESNAVALAPPLGPAATVAAASEGRIFVVMRDGTVYRWFQNRDAKGDKITAEGLMKMEIFETSEAPPAR